MNEELDPEILSYREFRKRQTLLEWQQRRRAFEAQRGREKRSDEGATAPLRPQRPAMPPPG